MSRRKPHRPWQQLCRRQRRTSELWHAANFLAPVEMRIDMKHVDCLADGVQRIEQGDRHAMITAERENLRPLFP